MIRIEIDLEEHLHAALVEQAGRRGRSVSSMAREAIVRTFGTDAIRERLRTLDGIAGLWRDRRDIGGTRSYVRRLRRDTRRTRRRKG